MTGNILKKFYEWAEWESIMHSILLLLIFYILFLFYKNKDAMNVTNLLLLSIVLAIDTLIHQNINIRNNKTPTYLL